MFRFSTFFRSRAHGYSTVVHPPSGNRNPSIFIVDYLINSLKFSKKDAIVLSSKGNLTHLKSPINSDLIVSILKNYGLNNSQIKDIVFSAPKILTCKAKKTLEPKIRAFHDLGLAGSDLVNLIKRNPEIFWYGLHTRIMPGLTFLKKLLGSDENVVEVINKSRWVYCTNNSMKRITENMSILQDFGMSNERFIKFVLSNPEKLMVNPKLLESKLSYVEEKLGIPRGSPSFIHAVSVTLYLDASKVEKKMEVFRGFGWCDSDIALLFRNQPYCLNKSDNNMSEKLEFYMKELGYTPSYLISCASFFTFSLKKRVIPRYKMLKMLKEKKLIVEKPLITVVSYSEEKFLQFLRSFEKDIPGFCEIYIDSVAKAS